MRYLCVHCDHRFEHEGDDEPRCPKCMRVHGVEKLRERSVPGRARGRTLWASAGAAVVLLVGGAYAWWAFAAPQSVSGDPPLRPLSDGELRGYLKNARVDAAAIDGTEGKRRPLTLLLEADDAVTELADEAGADGGSNVKRARAVVSLIRARAEAGAFVPWSMSGPREEPIGTAAVVAKRIAKDGSRAKLYPLEVTALAVGALRQLGVDAMVAEAWGYEGQRSPPEPSGYFGYYVVAVWPEEVGKGDPLLLDAYGGRSQEPAKDAFRPLTDVQAVGAALHHLAIHRLMSDGKTDEAFELSRDALALDRRSPAARTVRGFVLLQSGGINEGLQEVEAALQLRSDPPRRKNMAVIHLARGNMDAAAREVAAALESHPDYAEGHATLGALHLQKGEQDLARAELETAERLDPHLLTLPMLWAQVHLQEGELERAVAQARKAVEQRPHNWQTRLQAAQIYRQASYYDDMRREAQRIVQMVPPERRAQVRQLVEQVLGPTAFDEVWADSEGADGGAAGDLVLPDPEGLGDLQLGQGSSLLGDGAGGGGDLGAGSLLGDEGDLGGGPLPSPGAEPKLRLRDPGQSLKLDLGE